MEKKINIAELLKDCPQGMKLYCAMFEGLEFDSISEESIVTPIMCRIKLPNGNYNTYNFTKYGCWSNKEYAKCVIYPKGKTTWEGFVPPCKFKVGDKIKNKNTGICDKVIKIFEDCYLVTTCLDEQATISFDIQDNWELVPNKFDITTLKPFDKVLTRTTNSDVWGADLFGFYKDGWFLCNGHIGFRQCIPYKENEHLLGTTNDCDDFYKTW